jgi:hypothetical protein
MNEISAHAVGRVFDLASIRRYEAMTMAAPKAAR